MLKPMYKHFSTSLLFISLLFVPALHADGPELVPGKWEFILNDAMSLDLDKLADLLEQERATQDDEFLDDEYSGGGRSAVHTKSLLDKLKEAQEPHFWFISEEKAKQGVIAIFAESDAITQESTLNEAACVHSIEWKNQYEGIVSAQCADDSVIEGIVKVTDNKQIQYEATVIPADAEPYPVGWNAKWISE